MNFDTIIRGGLVATAADVVRADVGIVGGRVAALAERLTDGARIIDAGGQTRHARRHRGALPPRPASGARPRVQGRVWPTTSAPAAQAAFGGTTTIIPFAAQHRGVSLTAAVDDYHRRAAGQCVLDYGFHLIVSDPTPAVLGQELPALIRRGHTARSRST